MRLGTAFHVATLEWETFQDSWARGSELSGRTKEGKAAKAELEEQYDFDKILKPDDYDTVCAMRESVLGHSIANHFLQGAETEVAAFWADDESGIECKAKIDALPTESSIAYSNGDYLVDLKSTVDASPEHMAKAIANFGYARQAAHYLSPFEDRDRFIIIACEKKPPFALAVYEISPAAIQHSAFEVQALLLLWERCIDGLGWDAEWPSYTPDEIIKLDLPAWAY
jgi:exodeoxyribonuclease VIII